MTRYHVTHRTTYRYSAPVTLAHNEAHLRPQTSPVQKCYSHELKIVPEPAMIDERIDYFGNAIYYFALQRPHSCLDVVSKSDVEVTWPESIDTSSSPSLEQAIAERQNTVTPEMREVSSYVLESPFVPVAPALRDYAAPSFPTGRPVLEGVRELIERIHTDFVFDPTATSIATPVLEVLANRRGVCQDFAHLSIGCLRSMGLPARYVSGYLETIPPAEGAPITGADESHAWVATYLPSHGWVDFDPTNNLFPTSKHVILAWGRDYGDVTPLKGVITGGGWHSLEVAVQVERIPGISSKTV